FGISGNKKGGYEVKALLDKLNTILGKDEVQNVIVVGAGHIASALVNYKGFEKEGIKIAAAFEIDSAKYNKNSQVPVLPMDELNNFVKARGIKIGIIAVPDIAAQQAADLMFGAGIRGILNFAPIRLRTPNDECVVNNVNLVGELENVIYFTREAKRGNTA
ncbi:MAG: redox-sensing transcriptional repressor Rex, partial [Candidatus Omnitrophica bacterium]|nr:redox-sensing transcriptional repressor Rex [Candidatus Omnitrophota bacterium]